MKSGEDIRTVARQGKESETVNRSDLEITAHRCTPERTVFTEADNTDGWIATDLTVDLRR